MGNTTISLFGKILKITDSFSQKIREIKLISLLKSYQKRFESSEKAIKQFKKLFKSRSGLILLEKIIHILNDGAEDKEWIDLLGGVLKNIANSEIEKHFEELSYTLAQIAKLSPQALIVLSKTENWLNHRFPDGTTMSNQTIVGDWEKKISESFAEKIGIVDDDKIIRIAHTFRELEMSGMVYINSGKFLVWTEVGKLVHKSII